MDIMGFFIIVASLGITAATGLVLLYALGLATKNTIGAARRHHWIGHLH
jgi:hypothetical protein